MSKMSFPNERSNRKVERRFHGDDSNSSEDEGARGFGYSPPQRPGSSRYQSEDRFLPPKFDYRAYGQYDEAIVRQDVYRSKPEERYGPSKSKKASPLYGFGADLRKDLVVNDRQRDIEYRERLAASAKTGGLKKLAKRPVKSAKPRIPETNLTATKSNSKLVVAAIDFGTTYSGYAFSLRHEYDINPTKIHANEWRNVAQGNMNVKTPTCLLLEPDRKLHSFGNEAKAKYTSLCEENKHKDWYFFWEFKMTLHHQKEITQNYTLKEENNKLLDALTVFSLSIKALKDRLILVLQDAFDGVRDNDITWVITVPAIWNDSAKKFMRLAAEKAGLNKNSIEIALEPEAASIFCRLLPLTRDPKTETGVTIFPAGARYMILDCGGGTVDVTVHEVLEDNNLKELHKATGGNWGGAFVNKAFFNFMASLVGPVKFDNFSKTDKSGYLELLDEFENKKRMTDANSTDRVTIRIPIGLQELLYSESVQQNLQRKYGDKVNIHSDKLRMDADLFRGLFQGVVRDIIAHTHDLMDSLPRPVKAILMVGGFSESPVLQDAVKKAFGDRVKVIIPPEASLCVMKGAVLYGHRPSMITERKSRYTYGVAITVPFVSEEHPENRKYTDNGEYWCDCVFDKHVEIGQTVRSGEVQATKTYYPMSTSDTIIPVIVYRSTDANPMFVDERSCDCVGHYFVKREPGYGKTTKQDAVKVGLLFGDSDIKVVTMKASGIVHKADFKIDYT